MTTRKKPLGASRASGVPFHKLPHYEDLRRAGKIPSGLSIQWEDLGKIEPVALIRDLKAVRERVQKGPVGPEWVKEAGDRYHRDVALFAGERRLPIIYQPGAFVTIHADEDAQPETVESLKRMTDLVVEGQQLKEEAIMTELEKRPEISSTEILEETLKHVRADRDLWERRGAVHRVTESKLKAAIDLKDKQLEKEETDNSLLEDVIAKAYAPLLNNHRIATGKVRDSAAHRNPVERARSGALEYCPTCDILVDMKTIADRRAK